jgi:membrane protein implicated in regulation of membrane protease activity
VARRPMMTERMIEIAPIVIAVLAGSFLAALMPTTTWVAITLAITAVVVAALWLRQRRPRHRR